MALSFKKKTKNNFIYIYSEVVLPEFLLKIQQVKTVYIFYYVFIYFDLVFQLLILKDFKSAVKSRESCNARLLLSRG